MSSKRARVEGGGIVDDNKEGESRGKEEKKQEIAVKPISLDLITCIICMDTWTAPTTLGSCGHTFCAGCLLSVNTCPICRAPITARSIVCYELRELALAVARTDDQRTRLMKSGHVKGSRHRGPHSGVLIRLRRPRG